MHGSRPLFFFLFFPAFPLETILPGSLYDDDITIHFLFGRAFFQLTFFSVQSPTEQVLGVQKRPQAHQMRCLPSPQPQQAKAELKLQLFTDFFFFPFPSLSSRQALVFPLTAGNSDNTVP